MESWLTYVNILLAVSVPIVLVGGLLNRYLLSRSGGEAKGGIGWQFIRYTVLALAVPIVGLLALNDALSSEAATLIAAFAGFAFGKKEG